MNEILQKRIEEAEKKIIQEYIESFRYENGMELEPPIKIFLKKIGNIFFEMGISFALQNQMMSDKEEIISKIEKLQLKWQVRAERNRKLKAVNDNRYSEFQFGKSIGTVQAYSSILQLLKGGEE